MFGRNLRQVSGAVFRAVCGESDDDSMDAHGPFETVTATLVINEK